MVMRVLMLILFAFFCLLSYTTSFSSFFSFVAEARFKATLYQVSNGEIFPEQRTRKLEEEEERQEKEREREQEREEEGGGPLTFVKSENEFGFPGKIAHNFLVSSFYRKEGKEEEGEKERKEEEGEGGKVVTEFRGRSFLPPDCLVRSCYYDLSFQEEGGEVCVFKNSKHYSKNSIYVTLFFSFSDCLTNDSQKQKRSPYSCSLLSLPHSSSSSPEDPI